MQISNLKISHPPDFIMTHDRVVIFHRIHLYIASAKLMRTESIPVARRSLWIPVGNVQSIIRSRVQYGARLNGKFQEQSCAIEITCGDSNFQIVLRLPLGLLAN
ncbi:MAG: hypothetical protein NT027_09665 [Proteobacteria bacterium]|nr:hypothetical protein [Pseudomonadota bacterium]